MKQLPSLRNLLAAGVMALTLGSTTQADERFFTYSYTADVLPKGGLEFEQWLTHRRGKAGETFSRWDIREELEYGVTDRLSVAGYLNFRQVTRTSNQAGFEEVERFSFEGISLEAKYQLLNPEKDPIGMVLYLEPTYNGNEYELEEKLIFSKNFGDKWVAAFNTALEQEFKREAGDTSEEQVLEFTTGLAYRLTGHWSVGLEGRYHRVYEGLTFGNHLGSAWFVGPNIHYGSAKWWATLTVLPQVAGSPNTHSGLELDEHEKIEVRFIAGYNF